MKKFTTALLLLFSAILLGNEVQLFVEPVDGNIFYWPNYKRLFHSIAGSPCNLTFKMVTPMPAQLKEIRNSSLTVNVPPGVRVEEILPQYTTYTGTRTEFDLPVQSTAGADGDTRYSFNLDKFLEINRDRSYASKKEISFYFEPQKFQPDREYKITYSFYCNGKARKDRYFYLKFLPPLQQFPLPRHLTLCNFVQLWQLNVRNPELLRKISLKYQYSGLASRALEDRRYPHNCHIENELRKLGWKFHYQFFTPIHRFSRQQSKGIEIKPATQADGSKSMIHHCPTAALKNQKLIEKAYRFDRYNPQDGDWLTLDNEPFGYWENACFCSECLDEFSKTFGIPRSALTSPEVIREKYTRQWLRHLCLIQARTEELAINCFKQKFPHSKVADYNYFRNFNDQEKLLTELQGCPRDPRDYDEIIDCHCPSAYSQNGKFFIELMKQQQQHLRKPMAATLSLDRGIGEGSGYLAQDQAVSPKGTRLKLLASASFGGPFIMLYAGIYYDGMIFVETARAMREIAIYESYFHGCDFNPPMKGELDPAWDQAHPDDCLNDDFSFLARGKGKNILTILFNFNKTNIIRSRMKYRGPLKKFHVLDRTGRKLYTYGNRRIWTAEDFNQFFHIDIAPEDAAFIEIAEAGKASDFRDYQKIRLQPASPVRTGRTLAQPMSEEELNRLKTALAAPVKSKSWHNTEVTVLKETIQVKTRAQTAELSIWSGLLTNWKSLRTRPAAVLLEAEASPKWQFAYGGAWSIMHSPSRLVHAFRKPLRYSPVRVDISDEGTATVRLGILHQGLYLEKTFTFSASAPEWTVRVSLKNCSSQNIRAGQWFRTCLNHEGMTYEIGGRKMLVRDGNNFFAESLETAEAPSPADYRGAFSGDILHGTWKDGTASMKFAPQSVQAINIYQQKQIQIMELMMPAKVLPPSDTASYTVQFQYKEKLP